MRHKYSFLGVYEIGGRSAFIYGPGGSEERIYSAARNFDRQLHETLGLTVLALVVLRVLWRALDKRPEPSPVARWMSITARVVHAALYVPLFALPLTAISGAWLEDHALTLLGGFVVPPALNESHALGTKIADVHTWLGDSIMWLAGAHAAAGSSTTMFLRTTSFDRCFRTAIKKFSEA